MECSEELIDRVLTAATNVHRTLGPGLLESVYETVPTRELERRGLKVERQKTVAFDFDGMHFDDGLRLDLLVDDRVVVELKSVERMAPVHPKQVLTYLRLLNLPVGLLINFNVQWLVRDGVRRVVNDFPE